MEGANCVRRAAVLPCAAQLGQQRFARHGCLCLGAPLVSAQQEVMLRVIVCECHERYLDRQKEARRRCGNSQIGRVRRAERSASNGSSAAQLADLQHRTAAPVLKAIGPLVPSNIFLTSHCDVRSDMSSCCCKKHHGRRGRRSAQVMHEMRFRIPGLDHGTVGVGPIECAAGTNDFACSCMNGHHTRSTMLLCPV